MSNSNPSPFTGRDGGTDPGYYAIIAGMDGSNNPDPLKTDGAGKLLTSVTGAGSGGTSATDDAAFTPGTDAGTPMMGYAGADTVDSGDTGVVKMDTSRRLLVAIDADNVGIGGGTQYTEDAAAAANPVGNALIGVRADTLAGITSTDGDNVAARMTDKGELYVKHVDAIPVTDNGGTLTVDGTVTANIGTVGTLATAAKQDTGNTSLATLAGAVSGTEVQVDVLTMPTTTVQATNLDIRDLAQATDNVRVYANTAKDGSGTGYVPLVDTDGHLQIDILSMPAGGSGLTDAELRATPVPVSGTVTANLAAGTNNIGDVDVLSSALPTGASTSANQTTIIGHLDGVEGLLTTIDGDTGGIATSTASIDTKTPALGQALAAASVPVVLTAAQVTTLTPPAAITGFGTAANQATIIGHVDGIETLLGTIDADTSVLAATDFATEAKQDAIITAIGAIPGGGGVQYTEGDTDASITGTALMMEGAANALVAAPGTAADGLLVNLGANNDVTVSGVSTAANQTTIIGHLDGVEGLLGTIDADTGNISTKIDTIAGAISGTEMQVDVLTMPTVTVTATNLDVQSGGADLATSTQAGAIQTAVELIDDTVATLGTTTYTEAATKGLIIGAVRRDADTTLANTTNEITPLQVDANGYLKVEVFSGQTLPVNVASGGIASGAIASGAIASGAVASGAFSSGSIASGAIAAGAITAGATSIATTEDTASAAGDHLVKVAQIRLDTPVSGANASNSGDYTQFIADSFGKTWTAGTYPEDLAHVAGEPIRGNGARRIDTAATSAGSSGDWATVDASAEGALWVTTTPTTTSGCLTFRSIDLDETEEEVKATAGNIYGYYFYNASSSVRYLKFYNATAASTTVGTTTPMRTYPIPAGAAGHVALAYPIAFSTALSVAVTTGLADNDTGAPGTNDFIINIDYK